MSIQLGFIARMMLQTHPAMPLARHLVATRTALPMSMLSASIVLNKVVPALEGQMESQRAHLRGVANLQT
jgi:hypothetical protein